jgi:hypothetical protein
MKHRSNSPPLVLLFTCLATHANGFHIPSSRQSRIATKPISESTSNPTIHIRFNRSYHHQTSTTSSRIYANLFEINQPSTTTDSTKSQIRNIAKHLASQTLSSLLSQSDAVAISDELFFTPNANSSPLFNDTSHEQYIKYWSKLILRLREERRTPADLLGSKVTKKLLSSISGEDGGSKSGSYDVNTVRTFLESDAINALFTQLLYDAIFEFTTKFDILGELFTNRMLFIRDASLVGYRIGIHSFSKQNALSK